MEVWYQKFAYRPIIDNFYTKMNGKGRPEDFFRVKEQVNDNQNGWHHQLLRKNQKAQQSRNLKCDKQKFGESMMKKILFEQVKELNGINAKG